MDDTIPITLEAEMLGEAFVHYAGMKMTGRPIIPYYVKSSTWSLKFPLVVSATRAETQIMRPDYMQSGRITGQEVEVGLDRDEMIEAIWLYLPYLTGGFFEQLSRDDISTELPEYATFTLGLAPKGSTINDHPHSFAPAKQKA